MSKRIFNVLLSASALILGLALYLIFRPETYVSKLLLTNGFNVVSLSEDQLFLPILKYYLPDFLWGFAFACGMTAVFEPKGILVIACGISAFAFGTLWEILQWLDAVNGTGDLIDISMYLMAAVAAILINLKELINEKILDFNARAFDGIVLFRRLR